MWKISKDESITIEFKTVSQNGETDHCNQFLLQNVSAAEVSEGVFMSERFQTLITKWLSLIDKPDSEKHTLPATWLCLYHMTMLVSDLIYPLRISLYVTCVI